jgi:hypothetical protein
MPRLRVTSFLFIAALAAALAPGLWNRLSAQSGTSGVRVTVSPETPYIVDHHASRALNFDLHITNETPDTLEVTRIDLSVFDASGVRVLRKFIFSKGAMSPGFLTVPERVVAPGETLGMFNPLHTFEGGLPLDRLEFRLQLEGSSGQEHSTVLVVHPEVYESKSTLQLPLRGPIVNYDGYDYYSHHRRIDSSHPMLAQMGLTANPVLFATDFSSVDSDGELYHGDKSIPENWVGYGAAVYAAASGRVVSAAGDVPDNRIEHGGLVMPDQSNMDQNRVMLGNHVILDHGNGEFTRYAHLASGSVALAAGDDVSAGDAIGEIGFSGDSGFHVHLHFGLVAGSSVEAALSVPPYFTDFRRLRGGSSVSVQRGAVDTGEIVESRHN